MRKIKKSDEVVVLSGKDKGKQGRVIRIVRDSYVIVENVNLVKQHVKGNPAQSKAGGILEREMPLHISNVALINPVTGKGDRVGFKFLEDGKKVRYFKSNGEIIVADQN
jgi:large subunit ribosomal protein L24